MLYWYVNFSPWPSPLVEAPHHEPHLLPPHPPWHHQSPMGLPPLSLHSPLQIQPWWPLPHLHLPSPPQLGP